MINYFWEFVIFEVIPFYFFLLSYITPQLQLPPPPLLQVLPPYLPSPPDTLLLDSPSEKSRPVSPCADVCVYMTLCTCARER